MFIPSNTVWEPFNSEHKILQASRRLVLHQCASCLGKLPAQPAVSRCALVWTRSQLSINTAWRQTRCGLRSLCSVPIVISDFTEITAPCHFTLQLRDSSSQVGEQSSACSRLWCLLVADSQSRPNYSWDHERGEMRDALDKASFPACGFEAGMERAWEGIINVQRWHLKNAVLNCCRAGWFAGGSRDLHICRSLETLAACDFPMWSQPEQLLPGACALSLSSVVSCRHPPREMQPCFRGKCFSCIYHFVCFSLSSPTPSGVLAHARGLKERQWASKSNRKL